MMMDLPATVYRFDDCLFDLSNLRLTVNGEIRPLEPKSFRLAQFLIENRHRAVSKDEILSVVWEGVAVSDNALTRAVAQLRKALDDDPKQPRYIETVPTLGYRFIGVPAEVPTEIPSETRAPEVAPVTDPTPAATRRRPPNALWIGLGVVTLIAAGVVAWRSRPVPSDPAPVTIPLTTYRGNETSPSFSPDGNQVAFSWNGETQNNFDIYVKGIGTDTALRLTKDPLPEVRPAWSPDGRTIAFERFVTPDRFEVLAIPALGGPERRLGDFGGAMDTIAPMAWSADSRWLVVPAALPANNRTRLMKISLDSGETSAITDPDSPYADSYPRISSDGTRLHFTRRPPRTFGDIYEARLDGRLNIVGAPRLIPLGGIKVSRSDWLEGEKEILATSQDGSTYRFPAEGTDAPLRVLWLPARISWLTVSRKGNRLAYAAARGDANIWRLDLTESGARPELLLASTFRDVYPRYSPDGSRLAFYSDRGGSTQIWVANASGSAARQLTFVKAGATAATWSPDGRKLALDSAASGIWQVYSMSADGGAPKQLKHGPSANFGATWSRDGRTLYFASSRTGRNEIWKMPADGGPAVQVTHNGGVKAVESPDGATLYFSKESGPGSIWRMPIGGGAEEKLTDSLFRFNFAVTARGIYYITSPAEDGKSELRLYSFADRRTSVVLAMGNPEFGLDVSPDGRYLVYAQLDDPAGVENVH